MRLLVLGCAAILATCAPFSGEPVEADCTGNRTYERILTASGGEAHILYRESTTRLGRALRVVRTVESIQGSIDPELVPERVERTVAPPFLECPTADAPFDPAVRTHTRLLHVTTTW